MLTEIIDIWPDNQASDRQGVAELERRLFEAAGRHRAEVARDLLRLDPANIDAFVVLAESAETTAEALALLSTAIRIGARLWGNAIAEGDEVAWWTHEETRPFMRAILAFGDALSDAGQRDRAVGCYRVLREMGAGDGLGRAIALEEMAVGGMGLGRR